MGQSVCSCQACDSREEQSATVATVDIASEKVGILSSSPVISQAAAPQKEASSADFQHIRQLVQSSGKPREDVIASKPGAKERPNTFKVAVTRVGTYWDNVGLTVSPDDNPGLLTIDEVEPESLIGRWNATQDPKLEVRVGDCISSVNGSTCDAEGMYHIIQSLGKGSVLQLQILPARNRA
mmetsp:Transcript_36843/g.64913  ORF Transcript_36843/g.64913 Transcript_36843/m.64913 type:complete len:181 (-) Transcript_36843:53-595(-)